MQPEETDPDKALWEGPPPPPNPETVMSDLSCQGTIAIVLREALREIQQEDLAAKATHLGLDSTPEEGDSQQCALQLSLSQQSVDRIMLSFGQAVAQSQQEQFASQDRQIGPAPAALLRGRIDHYNRHGSKWRFLVKDAEILPRMALAKNRRKRERPSLWQIAQQQQREPSVKIKRLEILVYNDIE